VTGPAGTAGAQADSRASGVAALSAPSVSLVVMAYNEAEAVAGVLREIDAVLAPSGLTYEVLVVDDGSDDGTGTIADDLAVALPSTRVFHHDTNRGIGEVYRTGFGAAAGESITFLPADGQFPATIVTQFAALMADADLVAGYFTDIRRSVPARVLSSCERLLYWLMFGNLPRFKGIMMFRRSLLSELGIEPQGRGWGVLMEILVKARRAGMRITSVPTPLRARRSGHSKVNNLRSVYANLTQAIELRRSLGASRARGR
jgi:glycosyltransferase involved in cell wall biosynthesis